MFQNKPALWSALLQEPWPGVMLQAELFREVAGEAQACRASQCFGKGEASGSLWAAHPPPPKWDNAWGTGFLHSRNKVPSWIMRNFALIFPQIQRSLTLSESTFSATNKWACINQNIARDIGYVCNPITQEANAERLPMFECRLGYTIIPFSQNLIDCINIFLVSLNLTQSRVTQERSLNWGIAWVRLVCGHICRELIVFIVHWCRRAQPVVSGIIP